MKKQILQLSLLILIALTAINLKSNAQAWKLIGNAGIDTLTNFLGTTDAKTLIFKTKNLERMRIQSGGKIGMGTKTPSAKLNVVSPDYASLSTPGILMLGNVTSSNMALDYNVIQARYNGTASSLYLNYYGGNTYLGASATVAVSSVGVLTTGLVGINGLSNSSYALNVNANSSIGGINITDPVDNTAITFTKSGLNYGAVFSKTSTSSGVETINSYNAGSGAGVYAGSVNSNGVYGYNGGGNAAGVYGYSSGGTGSVGVTGYCAGIGYGMSAYGNAGSGIYATSVSNYAGFFSGDVLATSYQTSDLKLKENIKDVTSAMDIINQLHPKLYNFRNDGNYKLMNLPKGNHYGLIAQDVEKVLPNLVKDSKFDVDLAKPQLPHVQGAGEQENTSKPSKHDVIDFKALNYTELIPIIIKGMQEQQAVIEKQQQQIDQLQQMIQNNSSASNSTDAKSAAINGAYLLQNAPNPFTQNTTVRCFVPSSVKQAQLVVYSNNGQLVKSYTLTNGMNNVTINAGTLASGKYSYSLIADGKKVDSKSMIMTQ